jgi:hypothetical protein
MKAKYLYFISILAMVIATSCKKEKITTEEPFIKIYDDSNGNKHFFPLCIAKASAQDGYIILSAYDGWQIQLLKTGPTGELIWSIELPNNYVNALPNIIQKNGQNYIVCMDAIGLFTYVLEINESNQTVSPVGSFQNILYPTAAHFNGQALYIQNYNRLIMETGVHKISSDFSSLLNSKHLVIGTSVEDRIVDHVSYIGKRIPFFIQTSPNNEYVVLTGFYNYSFSMVFLNPDLSFKGVYNGAGFNGGVAAISPINSTAFALSRFSYDNLYSTASVSINPSTIDIVENIPAQGNSEIDAQKPVIIKDVTINETSYKAFLASTRNNQLLLSLYDSNGTLIGKKYIGKNNPYRLGDMIQTDDLGIAITLQVKIMGSFDRIGLIKLSADQLKKIVKPE